MYAALKAFVVVPHSLSYCCDILLALLCCQFEGGGGGVAGRILKERLLRCDASRGVGKIVSHLRG